MTTGVNIPDIPLPFEAYHGAEPYIFVAYAHKDKAIVYPEIARLHALGYRIWYDEGIAPATDWPENVAEALDGCAYFIVFISPHAVASRNVCNEIHFALESRKPCLPVYLEKTPLTPGLKLCMGTIQAVYRWNISEQQYQRKLARTLPGELHGMPQTIHEATAIAPPPAPAIAAAPSVAYSGAASPNSRDLNIEWIAIPAGEFLYGEHKERRTLAAFRIMKYPVTVAQYRRFCEATGRQMPAAPAWGWRDTHPVVNVSWEDAAAFADWADLALPTDEEWEKAARGTDGREYPWGNGWDAAKCHCAKQKLGDAKETAPVGSYPAGASPYGVLDLAGNVWEWCESWYDKNQNTRVLRGGSWYYANPGYFRAAIRISDYPPTYRFNGGGFRCVLRSPGP